MHQQYFGSTIKEILSKKLIALYNRLQNRRESTAVATVNTSANSSKSSEDSIENDKHQNIEDTAEDGLIDLEILSVPTGTAGEKGISSQV